MKLFPESRDTHTLVRVFWRLFSAIGEVTDLTAPNLNRSRAFRSSSCVFACVCVCVEVKVANIKWKIVCAESERHVLHQQIPKH